MVIMVANIDSGASLHTSGSWPIMLQQQQCWSAQISVNRLGSIGNNHKTTRVSVSRWMSQEIPTCTTLDSLYGHWQSVRRTKEMYLFNRCKEVSQEIPFRCKEVYPIPSHSGGTHRLQVTKAANKKWQEWQPRRMLPGRQGGLTS